MMSTQTDLLATSLSSTGILNITLTRPESLNALNAELMNKLLQTFLSAKENPRVKALLLTGEGKAFCAGADIKQLAQLNGQQGLEFARHGQLVFRTLEQLGKPSLAAVNGFAFGGGCELAMASTIRIASTTASFGQPEVKLGVIPGFGGTQRLARLVGKGRALDVCLTARTIKADEALLWGLVSEVVPGDQLMTRAEVILTSLIQLAPLALKSVMTVIDRGYDLSLEDAFELEAVHFGLTCGTRDKEEGTKAFIAKRPAIFSGE